MSFDAQTLDPKSEVSEVAEAVEGPKRVAAENPRRRPPGNQQCQKSTSAKSATGALPTQLVEIITKKRVASKRSLSRNLSKARKSRDSNEAWMNIGCHPES